MNRVNLKVPILVYHEIVNDGEMARLTNVLQRKYIVEKGIFDKQLQYLSDNNYECLNISEITAFNDDSKRKIACITFDDGYAGNFQIALPLLKKYGLKATFFIVTQWIGTEHMMTWEQIKTLMDEGMEIGSHTNSHRLLETCDKETIQNELAESKENIKKFLGYNTQVVSYPNGSYSLLVNEIAKNAGYSAVLTSDFGYAERKNTSFSLKRIFITNNIASLINAVKAGTRFLLTSYCKEYFKRSIRWIIGRGRYDRIYNKLYNIDIR